MASGPDLPSSSSLPAMMAWYFLLVSPVSVRMARSNTGLGIDSASSMWLHFVPSGPPVMRGSNRPPRSGFMSLPWNISPASGSAPLDIWTTWASVKGDRLITLPRFVGLIPITFMYPWNLS